MSGKSRICLELKGNVGYYLEIRIIKLTFFAILLANSAILRQFSKGSLTFPDALGNVGDASGGGLFVIHQPTLVLLVLFDIFRFGLSLIGIFDTTIYVFGLSLDKIRLMWTI